MSSGRIDSELPAGTVGTVISSTNSVIAIAITPSLSAMSRSVSSASRRKRWSIFDTTAPIGIANGYQRLADDRLEAELLEFATDIRTTRSNHDSRVTALCS